MAQVNGKQVSNIAGLTLADYLRDNNYNISIIAVEINSEIVPKHNYENYTLAENDKIEIVQFVGGG